MDPEKESWDAIIERDAEVVSRLTGEGLIGRADGGVGRLGSQEL